MGSIGDAFPYAAPVNGTAGWANWIAVTDELIDRVSSPVPLSALEGGDLDLDNSAIINVKDILFYEQTSIPTTTPGGLYFYADEWWVVTTAGAIKITSGGALNITLNGGIGGDYGSPNPASVEFVDADNRYDFYDDFAGGEWGRLRGLSFDVAGGLTSAVRARINYAGAGNLTFTLPPTVPAAGDVALLSIDENGLITTHATAAALTSDIVLDTDVKVQHSNRIRRFNARHCIALASYTGPGATWLSSAGTCTFTANKVNLSTAGCVADFLISTDSVERLKVASVGFSAKNNAGNTTMELFSVSSVGVEVSLGTDTRAIVGGNFTLNVTVGAPAVTTGTYLIRVTSTPGDDDIRLISYTYDVAA